MRQFLLILCIASITFSCGGKNTKTRETQIKSDSAVVGTDSTVISNNNTDKQTDFTIDTIASLMFEGYYVSKSGFPHLEFRDMDFSNYDFEDPYENNLEDIPLVLKSKNAASGYIQNDELVGNWFTVTIITKMSNTYDFTTVKPIKALRWRIGNIKRDPYTKTMKLMFNGYEEGDYAHLLFKDTETGDEYDFGHPNENNLGTSEVVLKNEKASFGYIGNDKLLGDKFIVTMVYKLSDTYDESGQPVKDKRWRIVSLRK